MNEGTPSANEPEIIIRSPREIRALEIYLAHRGLPCVFKFRLREPSDTELRLGAL